MKHTIIISVVFFFLPFLRKGSGVGFFFLLLLPPFGRVGVGFSQDLHLSQFYASPMTLNPATTGMFSDAYFRIHAHHRSQWGSIITKPYLTEVVAYDRPWKRFGFGGYILNNRAGVSNFNQFNFLASAAYEITNDPKKIHHVTTGVQLGFIQNSMNPDNLDFDNQYSDSDGGRFDKTKPSRENFSAMSFIVPDVNFGVYYDYTNPSKKFNPYGGAAGYHLTQPKQTFYGTDNRYPFRAVVYGGTKYKIDHKWSAEGNFMINHQALNNDVQIGALGFYYDDERSITFFAGPYYRNKDAAVIHIGAIYLDYTFRMTYDINVSVLKTLAGGNSGLEFSVTYKKRKVSYMPSLL